MYKHINPAHFWGTLHLFGGFDLFVWQTPDCFGVHCMCFGGFDLFFDKLQICLVGSTCCFDKLQIFWLVTFQLVSSS